MIIHPIYPIILSLFLIFPLINSRLINGYFIKYKLIFFCIHFIILVISLFFYSKININELLNQIYLYYNLVFFIIFILGLIYYFQKNKIKSNHSHLFVQSIKNSKANIYFLVDKHERVKEISDNFLNELGMSRKEAVGKKIFDLFDKSIRFLKFNNQEVNNNTIKEYYKTYRYTISEGASDKREIHFQNHLGQVVVINFIETPIFVHNNYKGRMNIGEKYTDLSILDVEKQLHITQAENKSLRHKLLAMIETTEDGLFFYDTVSQEIWFNDYLVKLFKLQNNDVSIENFYRLIHSDDLGVYQEELQNLTDNNYFYSITYRVKVGENYQFIKENGKKIFENEDLIVGYMKVMQNYRFEKSHQNILDNLANEFDLVSDIDKLFATHKYFDLAIVKLTNIPDINKKYGRQVGNMMMAEYIKKLVQNFMSEHSRIYRVSGLEFAMTITDVRKMDSLKKAIESDSNLMDLKIEYGGIKEEIFVNMGISSAFMDANESSDLINKATLALKITENPNFIKRCCYYKDMA